MAQSKQAEEADEAFNKGFFYNAIEMYNKAYTTEKKAGEKAVLIFKVAQAYRALGDGENAQVWYEKANKAQYPDPITYYYIGEAPQGTRQVRRRHRGIQQVQGEEPRRHARGRQFSLPSARTDLEGHAIPLQGILKCC
ncbi:MAG: hypothetical protein IPF78_16385 [Flavobacteriales bacterium]|nr:hypothetical protein [Flavobacteriales bacterium]